MAILDFWDSQDPKNRVSKKRIFEPIGPRERVYLRFLGFSEPIFWTVRAYRLNKPMYIWTAST